MLDAILKVVISTLALSIITWVISKVVTRFILPVELKNRLDAIEVKFDKFIDNYNNGSERNRMYQKSLFTMQDIQFDAMKNTNGAVRELAKSVCNGNKKDAIRLCDESDCDIKKGKDIHREVSMIS